MIERLVAPILARYLENFIEVGQLSKDLKLSITSGQASLVSVALKRECLSFLGLPLVVKFGRIGKLEISIPWSALTNGSVVIRISDVSVVVSPKYEADLEQVEKNYQRKKKSWLQLDDLIEEKNNLADGTTGATSSSWSGGGGVLQRAFDNVQIYISNVNIRYEDDITILKSPFVAGISISEIFLETTDSNWEPKFVSGQEEIFRMITITKFSAYWNIGEFEEVTTVEDLLKIIEMKEANKGNEKFLVAPVNAKAKLSVNRNSIPVPDKPKVKANVEIDDLTVNLEDKQYKQVFSLLDVWYDYSKSERVFLFLKKTLHINILLWPFFYSTEYLDLKRHLLKVLVHGGFMQVNNNNKQIIK